MLKQVLALEKQAAEVEAYKPKDGDAGVYPSLQGRGAQDGGMWAIVHESPDLYAARLAVQRRLYERMTENLDRAILSAVEE